MRNEETENLGSEVPCLNGSTALLKRCVGYCKRYQRYITESQMKLHNCLHKGKAGENDIDTCNKFIVMSNSIWNEKDLTKIINVTKKDDRSSRNNRNRGN